MQRLGDEFLVYVRAVTVGGVEEIHAQLERLAQHGVRGGAVPGRSPDIRAADAHRAEAQAIYGQVGNVNGLHGFFMSGRNASRPNTGPGASSRNRYCKGSQ